MDTQLAKTVKNLRNQGLSFRGVALYIYAQDDSQAGMTLCNEAATELGETWNNYLPSLYSHEALYA